ncbi:unnamed protein product [Neospora caninum Liverpool]|uniref:Uncharacterized protein n=1 Tax=Neospora caninum (strain Liverpool) TaxID=572307 RepID=F0VKT2_NEOCL|nr:uncharacterized protein NCLIV_051095 [Neospora caninum Liverpool]CBZ54683.1 unnamed protein product [Neospora caninum Liverpool]|eukprot:XP_003884713.1 uncharacterized protein NCLIV_051095 [Neospora caninum Liverpool]
MSFACLREGSIERVKISVNIRRFTEGTASGPNNWTTAVTASRYHLRWLKAVVEIRVIHLWWRVTTVDIIGSVTDSSRPFCFRREITKQEQAAQCQRCHQTNSRHPFLELGLTLPFPKRVEACCFFSRRDPEYSDESVLLIPYVARFSAKSSSFDGSESVANSPNPGEVILSGLPMVVLSSV